MVLQLLVAGAVAAVIGIRWWDSRRPPSEPGPPRCRPALFWDGQGMNGQCETHGGEWPLNSTQNKVVGKVCPAARRSAQL